MNCSTQIIMKLLPDNPTQFDYLHAIRAVASRSSNKEIFDLADAGMQTATSDKFEKAGEALCKYFAVDYPQVINHSGRAELRNDGTWHFYLHPDGVNGETIDLIISTQGITLMSNDQGLARRAQDSQ